MSQLSALVLCLGICMSLCRAQDDFVPKRFYLQVRIVTDGQPAASIVCPPGQDYAAIAARVQEAVRQASGATLPIIPPDQALPEHWTGERSFILLGKLGDSEAVDALYVQHYVCSDARWPGAGGHELRTIHDPYGTGACGVMIGGSDLAGVEQAARRFSALLPAGRDIVLPHTIDLSGPAVTGPMSQSTMDTIRAGLPRSNFRQVGAWAHSACLDYYRSGDPNYALIAKEALYRLADIVAKMKAIDDSRGVIYLPAVFDLCEEATVWTDEDRDRLSRFLYQFALKAPYADSVIEPSPIPEGNNWDIRTAWECARYFQKYYGMDIQGLVAKCDQYFRNMMTWKSREDCPGYGSMTVIDILHYVLKKPAHEMYFDSGLARQMADYAMTVTDNLGGLAGFGDISDHHSSAHFPDPMSVLAWKYRDGRYLWIRRHMAPSAPGAEFLGQAFAISGLEPVPPNDLLGVHVLPLESWIYDNRDDVLATGVASTDALLRAGEDPPHEQCFDKISFRAGFGEDDQYLLLGGISHGYHAHPDGNAIISFTDRGKLWLFDNGYFVPDTVEHNTIAVFRDGLFQPIPRLTGLHARADLPGVGMTRTCLRNYNGMDWYRNIIWRKERWFVVLDELTAREPGDFGAQCIFRVIGERDVRPDRVLARQGVARFALVTDGHPTWSVHQVTPEFAAARGLFENQDARLAAGESMTFQNLFYCPEGSDDFPFELLRATPTCALVAGGDEVTCVGAGQLQAEGLPAVDAAAYCLTPAVWSLCEARSLAWPEPVLRCEGGAANVHLDLPAGSGVVETAAAVTLSLPTLRELKLNGRPVNGVLALPPGRHELTFAPQQPSGERSDMLAQVAARARQARDALLAQRVVAGDEQPDLIASVQFTRQVPRTVFVDEAGREAVNLAGQGTASAWTEAQKGCNPGNATDGNLETYSAVGSGAPHATALPKDLGVEWPEPVTVSQAWFWHYSAQYVPAEDGHDIQYWNGEDWVSVDDEVSKPDPATWVHTFAPVTTTRLRLFITAFAQSRTAIREMAMFDRPVTPQERMDLLRLPVRALTTADLNGDGIAEILACVGDELVAISAARPPRQPDGQDLVLWRAPVGSGFGKCLAVYDLNADGAPEIVVGGSDHKVHCFSAAGAELWVADCPSDPFQPEREPMTGTIDVIAAGDINQDGKGEVVFGSANWFAYALDHTGKLLWKALNWAHPPLDITLFDVTGDGNLEALIATRYNTANLFDYRGKQVDSISAGYHGIPMSVACGDLDGNGRVEMLIGSRIGGVHCKEYRGERLWDLNMGAQVTDVAVADLNGDGLLEGLACSANRYVICFDADGKLLWRRNVGGAARQMALADHDGDGRPAIIVCVQDGPPVLLSVDGELLARIPTATPATVITVADVNGDGVPELIAGGEGAVEVAKLGG